MKKVWKTLFYIPIFLFRMLLHLIWGLFKIALVVFILLAGFNFYAQNSDSQLATSITSTKNDIIRYLTNNNTNLTTDEYAYYTGIKWPSNTATIYIESTNQTLYSAYQTAIQNWNDTGVFTFTLTDDASSADIVASDASDSNSQAAGLTETERNEFTNQITHATITLNSYYLIENPYYGYTTDRIIHTAEHELGHAIGLDHDDSEISVMQSAGSYYGIQQTDINKVASLYAA
ncbi:MAG: M57 family metalloprotease [Absicoccus porci]|uniref:M57 family metalloprotease n=1 Tax=Absicoccus porci TaxID=2486576 RepID=UPI0023F331BC|nr:M57 family metalloprotease [Absicoccus porci]MDD7330123.1 M57 family metalloprotease [Absicoccus porci]MDY4739520.1 M57 family metalloprotease [Absicoccus porci]